jgi:hypothetical protein
LQSISYVKPAANYIDALTLGPNELGQNVDFTIDAGGPAIFQLGRRDNNGKAIWDNNELVLTGVSSGFDKCTGIRFRQGDPTKIPVIVASAYLGVDKWDGGIDPIPTGSTPFTSLLTVSGGIITPGGTVDLANAVLSADPAATLDISAATEGAPDDLITCNYNANGTDIVVVSVTSVGSYQVGFNLGDLIGLSLWIDGVNTGRMGALVCQENAQATAQPITFQSGRFVPASGARTMKIRAWTSGAGTKSIVWGAGGIGLTPSAGGMFPATTMRVSKVG